MIGEGGAAWSSPRGGSWRGWERRRRGCWHPGRRGRPACPLCPQPVPRAEGRPAGLPGHARPPADLTSAPGMRALGPAAPPGWARAMELSMRKFTVRRFFSVYLRRKSRSKSSSLSRLEVTRPRARRVPVRAAPRAPQMPRSRPPRALPMVTCTVPTAACRPRAEVVGEPVRFPGIHPRLLLGLGGKGTGRGPRGCISNSFGSAVRAGFGRSPRCSGGGGLAGPSGAPLGSPECRTSGPARPALCWWVCDPAQSRTECPARGRWLAG